jgi:hypothetical protein
MRSGIENEEEEWDLNKKNYLNELKRSNFEKKVFVGSIIIAILFWTFYYQSILIVSQSKLDDMIKK